MRFWALWLWDHTVMAVWCALDLARRGYWRDAWRTLRQGPGRAADNW